MGDWNPVKVEQQILETVNELARSVGSASEAYEKLLTADREYDLAFAKSYMSYEGAAHAKKYAAEIATEPERIARDVAEAAYRLFDRSNKALERKLDALRSIGASVRQAYQDAGRGEW